MDNKNKIEDIEQPKATTNATNEFQFSAEPSLETLRRIQAEFCRVRNWEQFQTPRNLLLALVGEVGELSEIFQWKGEVPVGIPDWTSTERESLSHELSDVLIYLIRLAQVCNIDLPTEALNKIRLNELKYPTDKCFGSNKKYDQL